MTEQQKSNMERAIEIAQEKGHKVFTGKSRQTGETIYTVRSASVKNLFHVLYIRDGRIHCDCKCHRDGCISCNDQSRHNDHICSHAAAVRLFLIEQRDALAAIERQERKEATEPVIATSEEQGLAELLDHETTADEWEDFSDDEADAERRAEAMRRETQAEIEREAARKRETALPYDHTGECFSIFKPERPGFSVEEARHDSRPMRWNQQRGCYEPVDEDERARRNTAVAEQKAAMRSTGAQPRQREEW